MEWDEVGPLYTCKCRNRCLGLLGRGSMGITNVSKPWYLGPVSTNYIWPAPDSLVLIRHCGCRHSRELPGHSCEFFFPGPGSRNRGEQTAQRDGAGSAPMGTCMATFPRLYRESRPWRTCLRVIKFDKIGEVGI